MRKLEDEAAQLDAQRSMAVRKVKSQSAVVARLNGSLVEHPEEEQLLSEMRGNKAAIDFNRALLAYEQDGMTAEAANRRIKSK